MSVVTERQWDILAKAAQDGVKLSRLRAYLLPILIQQAKNIANAAANNISDFEAMKRGGEMLRRIENEEADQ